MLAVSPAETGYPAARPALDLSDNSVRADVLRRLVDSARADPAPGLAPWSMPLTPPPASHPSLAVGNVWQTLNQCRVLGQYTRLLGDLCESHPILTADPVTCVLGLEWMSGLVGPLACPTQQERQSVEQTAKIVSSQTGVDSCEALFHVHLAMPLYDRVVTRLLLESHFPDSREYEVDVCRCMLSKGPWQPPPDYQEWKSSFPRWRDKGLLYPLAVAALYMTGLGDWLPPQCWSTPLAHCFVDLVRSTPTHSAAELVPALQQMQSQWADDRSQTNLVLGHTLDRIAILMGVKSNGRKADPANFGLAAALRGFPRSFGAGPRETLYHAWHSLKYHIEDAFPPSLMCAPLVRPGRASWGFPTLTLRVSPQGTVSFAETELQPVAPPRGSEVHTHTPAYVPQCLSFQTSARVQDVLWRTGELLLSRHIALCVVRPELAAAEADSSTVGALDQTAFAPESLLAQMRPTAGAPPRPFLDTMIKIEGAVPPVHSAPLPAPCQLLLWRLDVPNRAIVYVGDGEDVRTDSEAQHHLPKMLLNSKVPACNVGGILAAGPDRSITPSTLRSVLRAFAGSGLMQHPSNTALIRSEPGETPATGPKTTPIVHTTLAESVACFSLAAPSQVSVSPINQSCPWQENGIDPRYAERQDAANGFRFRDWAAMHVGRAGTQQSRLAAHAIRFDTLYLTTMPWICGTDVHWVHVASTAPSENRTLQGQTLRQAVESRFLHDPRLLPVHPEGQAAPRHSAELYLGADGHLAIVYAPEGSGRLEMIAFRQAAT